MVHARKVLVAGAGVGGLSAALCLARAGHDVEVHERAPALRPEGAGLSLQPNGLVVLRALGLLDALRAHGSPLSHLTVFGPDGRVLARGEMPAPPPLDLTALVVPRGPLLATLTTAVGEAGIPVHHGSTVTGVHGHQVVVEGDGGTRRVPVDVLVGADGTSSTVRRSAGIPARAPGPTRWYVRGLVDVPARDELLGEYWDDGGIAGLAPCGEGRTYWYATATDAVRRAHDAGDLPAAVRALAAAHPALTPYAEALPSIEALLLNEVRTVRVRSLVRDPVALVGDAGHAMAPNLGQGANSALVDAAALTIELTRGADVPDALQRYDARRRGPVTSVQRAAEVMAFLGHLRRARPLRDLAVRITPATIQLQGFTRAQQCEPQVLSEELHVAWARNPHLAVEYADAEPAARA
jgi:2-polyprenyl-6-methoxyphenol hydroxylase-like FAD-dependent oxidoreductase